MTAFVVTDFVLENGEPPFLLDPAQTMADARTVFDAMRAEKQETIDSLLLDGRAESMPPADAEIAVGVSGRLVPMWDNEKNQLSVSLSYGKGESWEEYLGESPGTEGTPPHSLYQIHSYSVQYSAVFTFDASGMLLETVDEEPSR